MFNIAEYRRKPDRLADYLPWALFVKEGIVEQKAGLLQATIEFRGPDLESATPEGLIAYSARLNNALKRLGSGWALFVEAQRRRSEGYPESEWPDVVSKAVDEERRRAFLAEGAHFESRYFATFVYAPPKKAESSLLNLLFKGGGDKASIRSDREERLRHFEERLDGLVSLLREAFVFAKRLDTDETAEYLHSTVSTKRHPVKLPEVPVYLDAVLADQPLKVGTELKLGPKYLRTITVRAFPGTTVPGILDELNQLSFEYRWASRFIALDKIDAIKELKKYQKQWYAQRKGLGSVISEIAGGGGSDLVNSEAIARAQDADLALQSVAEDYVSYGYFTATVTVWGATRETAEERIAEVEQVINGRGFTTIRETLNAKQAWLSSLPGHVYANVRRPLVHTLNLVHMMPGSAVWSGPRKNDHLDGPVHIVARTNRATPFRLSLNVGDVGHTLVLGPTGAGKSTLLAFLGLQWLRYENAQVIFFDKGGSSRAATLGVGGSFYALGLGADEVAFQPLRNVDDESERAWAVEWLSEILVTEGVKVTAEVRTALWDALGPQGLASQPEKQRTMFGLSSFVQDASIRQALKHYIKGGQFGALFDNDEERWDVERNWVSFEMEEIMESQAVVPAVLSYLFHRIEQSFDGRPTLMVLDEAWVFLDHPMFAEKIREWLKVLRKKNVYVVFATQSVADAIESPIAPVLLESCLTRLLLPNGRALEPEQAGYYKRLGLNQRQVQILARATPKREYYYQSQKGNRLFDLGLGPVALAFCGASDPESQAQMDELIKTYGGGDFGPAWLALRGFGEAVAGLADGEDQLFQELDRTVADDVMLRHWEAL